MWSSVNVHFVFLFTEKLCKSHIETWGCYGDCSTSHKTKTSSSVTCSHSDEECCNSSRKRKSTSQSPSLKKGENRKSLDWRPLLLFIPLRLGLSETNPAYFSSLKVRLPLFISCISHSSDFMYSTRKPFRENEFV